MAIELEIRGAPKLTAPSTITAMDPNTLFSTQALVPWVRLVLFWLDDGTHGPTTFSMADAILPAGFHEASDLERGVFWENFLNANLPQWTIPLVPTQIPAYMWLDLTQVAGYITAVRVPREFDATVPVSKEMRDAFWKSVLECALSRLLGAPTGILGS